MSQPRDRLMLDWNSMLVNLVVKGFSDGDEVSVIGNVCSGNLVITSEQEAHFIKEMKPSPVDQCGPQG